MPSPLPFIKAKVFITATSPHCPSNYSTSYFPCLEACLFIPVFLFLSFSFWNRKKKKKHVCVSEHVHPLYTTNLEVSVPNSGMNPDDSFIFTVPFPSEESLSLSLFTQFHTVTFCRSPHPVSLFPIFLIL